MVDSVGEGKVTCLCKQQNQKTVEKDTVTRVGAFRPKPKKTFVVGFSGGPADYCRSAATGATPVCGGGICDMWPQQQREGVCSVLQQLHCRTAHTLATSKENG